jgi:dihydroflavonol-4-reductase
MAVVAVTGATGFLGRHIVAALQRAGHPVRAVVRRPDRARELFGPRVDVRAADLGDLEALQDAFVGATAVVSNAALGSWQGPLEKFRAVNVDGTRHVLDAMKGADVGRLVHISTVAVGRTQLGRWADELVERYGTSGKREGWQPSDLTTDWRYAVTKSAAEDLVRERGHDLDVTILRPGPVFGVGDDKLTRKYLRMWRSRVCVAPTARVPHVCGSDVAAAVVGALGRPASVGGTYVISGPPVSPHTIVRRMTALAGRGPVLLPLPVPVRVGFTTHRAARDLGFVARPLDDALSDVLRSQGVRIDPARQR